MTITVERWLMCTPTGKMLNEALIEAGLSEAVTRHPYRSDRKTLFEAAEERAYGKKIGIWSQAGRKPR